VEAEGGHELVMVGWPEAAWHLELIDDRHGKMSVTLSIPT
jgi:hypothetical protein